MSFEYEFPEIIEGMAEGVAVGTAGVVLGILLIFWFLMMGLGVVCYVLHAVGSYRIAKRRGIHNAWLAWIPVGEAWLLGSISDHYQYVAKNKTTKRRSILLVLSIILFVVALVTAVLTIAMVTALETDALAGGVGAAAGIMIASLITQGVAIAQLVFCYIAYYDLFRSCKPKYDVLFLVLGIIFPITLSFFVFACCGADEGMPARRMPKPPVQIPYQPAEAEQEIPVVETEVVDDAE